MDLMGVSREDARPEWMIVTVLPVPPPQVRPSVAVDGGMLRGEDDLTYKLVEIIRTNQTLRRLEGEGAPAHVLSEFETLLQVPLSFQTYLLALTNLLATVCFDSGMSLRTWTTTCPASLRRSRSRGDRSNRSVRV
jgi:hypothetical protein